MHVIKAGKLHWLLLKQNFIVTISYSTDYMVKKRVIQLSSSTDHVATVHICSLCTKDCHSHIGLLGHKTRCSKLL